MQRCILCGEHYERYHVKARISKFFDPTRIPLADERLTLEIEDTIHPAEALYFVADTQASRISHTAILRELKIVQSLLTVKAHDYGSITRASCFTSSYSTRCSSQRRFRCWSFLSNRPMSIRDLGYRSGPHSPPLPTSFPSVRYCRVLNRRIRKIIQGDLAMISNGNIDWQRLIGDGDQVGKRIEEEADRAKQDKRRFLEQQSFGP